MIKSKKLGEILVEGGLLTQKQIDQVLPFQKKSNLKLGQFLVREGIVSEVQIVDLLSNQLKIEKYRQDERIPDMELAQLIPAHIAQKYSVAPLQKIGMLLKLAMTDPLDITALDAVEELTKMEAEAVICTEQQLNQLHTALYGTLAEASVEDDELDFPDISATLEQEEKTGAAASELSLEDTDLVFEDRPASAGSDEDLMLDLETLLDEGHGPVAAQASVAAVAATDNFSTEEFTSGGAIGATNFLGYASVGVALAGAVLKNSTVFSKPYDNVYFSAYYPHEVMNGNRYSIVFYAHIEKALKEIKKDINKFVEEIGGKIDAPKKSKLSAMIKEGTVITVVAECDELDFNPAAATKRWEGPFTRFLFDLTVPKKLRASTLFARFSVQVLGIEIAQVKFSIEVVKKVAKKSELKDYSSRQSGLYKNIFLSYSLKDRDAVNAYRSVFQSFSEDIFIDSNSLDWLGERNLVLPKVLKKSDVFYLFWSQNAASSPTVRQDFETAIKHRCLGNYAAKPCRSFVRMVHWDQPLQPEPWPELKDFKPVFLPQLKGGHALTSPTAFPALYQETAKQLMNYVRNSFGPVAGEFQKALDYAETDPSGSLNKTRIVLEAMLLNSYRREMGKDPREKHVGVILCENQFTRKLDRMIFFRIKTVRDLGNLGSHGEPVDPKDARYGLEDLFDVIDWHRRTYHSEADGRTSPALP